ncbi:MAG: PilZ domain-containing protein [Deltaproteobacteria bacterium]|nr:PilZ domain-containing protein [Deltaproteobacteria bacterium]
MERAKLHTDVEQTDTAVSSNEKRLISANPTPTPAVEAVCSSKKISMGHLINKLNYLNFLDKPLYVNYRHKHYHRVLSIKAKPQPCQDNRLICLWQQDAGTIVDQPDCFYFQNILIPDGNRFIVAEPDVVEISREAIRFILPETCSAEDARSTRRHSCRSINVYVTQNGALFYGSMIDFSAFSFRVKVQTTSPQTFDWMNTDLAVNVIIFDGSKTLYSGECRIGKQTHGHKNQDWILTPVRRHIRRFRPKEFRSTRQQMVPLPTISFVHPFSKKRVQLEVRDLSGSGLAVREEVKHAVLLPGLIIPNLQICFGDGAHVTCAAQVVYSQQIEDKGETGLLRCGIAILDMPADEHIKVLSLIQQTSDKNAYICRRVNLDDLWNFFFETGFIYPQKYEFIEKNKARIKETYKKLYTESPNIARHFIHQRNGMILAHMSMVRFYEKSWLMHHLAAIRSSNHRGGLAVFNQIGSFINDSHRLNSIKMSYAFCYYRPENKFPNHVFGGAAKNILNPKKCSIDQFAYFHFRRNGQGDCPLPGGWHIESATDNDLRDLECHYEEQSGGLMIDALDLGANNHDMTATESEFSKIGLLRSRHLFSLKMLDELKALIIINIADIGLNMSDLTNSVKIIILKHENLKYQIIRSSLLNLFGGLQIDEMPVLIYPVQSATAMEIPTEKTYNLWIFDLNHTDDYFRYLKRLLKFYKH